MKLTLEMHDKKTILESDYDDINMEDMIHDFIRPILVSAGFTQETINEYIKKL